MCDSKYKITFKYHSAKANNISLQLLCANVVLSTNSTDTILNTPLNDNIYYHGNGKFCILKRRE